MQDKNSLQNNSGRLLTLVEIMALPETLKEKMSEPPSFVKTLVAAARDAYASPVFKAYWNASPEDETKAAQ